MTMIIIIAFFTEYDSKNNSYYDMKLFKKFYVSLEIEDDISKVDF